MDYDDWYRLYREDEKEYYEYLLYVNRELRRLKRRAERRGD